MHLKYTCSELKNNEIKKGNIKGCLGALSRRGQAAPEPNPAVLRPYLQRLASCLCV